VVAFTRFDDKNIREKNQIYTPDCLVVVDPTLITLPTLFAGLKPEGVLILNGPKQFEKQPNENLQQAGIVDATKIAVEEVGRDVPNTCLLGAFAAVTGWVTLDSVKKSVAEYFSGEVLKKNLRCVERGYNEVKVTKWH
jgi:2-oxoacid:acceptor oxidoreductase gamma subunit (pyruvate/2-ketoisovalerate family)